MAATRRTQIVDAYASEVMDRIDGVKARIVSGELSDAELAQANEILRDLSAHLDARIEELKKSMEAETKPKKMFGFI
jgi:hypothetical protein